MPTSPRSSRLTRARLRQRVLPVVFFGLFALGLSGCATGGFKPSVITAGSFQNPDVGFKGLNLKIPADWRLVTQKPDPAQLSGFARSTYDAIKEWDKYAVGWDMIEHNIWEFEGGAASILICTTSAPGAQASSKVARKLYADRMSTSMRTGPHPTARKILEINGRYVPTFSRFYPSKGTSDNGYVSVVPPGYEIFLFGVYGLGNGLKFEREATQLLEQINHH